MLRGPVPPVSVSETETETGLGTVKRSVVVGNRHSLSIIFGTEGGGLEVIVAVTKVAAATTGEGRRSRLAFSFREAAASALAAAIDSLFLRGLTYRH